MVNMDLHLHTFFSHGVNSPLEMHMSAIKKGMGLIGFTEHSPRPVGYDYEHEYRDHLLRLFPDYIGQVKTLAKSPQAAQCGVLLGLEMDWIPAEEEFVRSACHAHDYNYLLGSVHFIDHWGFDDNMDPWLNLSQEECERYYIKYFKIWRSMMLSGLFQIASHPDLVKIYSVRQFHTWLDKEESRELVKSCLVELKNAGMAMEISSAGLRKKCAEIYPCPQIMDMAADLDIPLALSSDAHNIADIGFGFQELENYARSFGYDSHVFFQDGRMHEVSF